MAAAALTQPIATEDRDDTYLLDEPVDLLGIPVPAERAVHEYHQGHWNTQGARTARYDKRRAKSRAARKARRITRKHQ